MPDEKDVLSGGFQASGPLSPFDRLTSSVTACGDQRCAILARTARRLTMSCGLVRSFANDLRRVVVQEAAPD